jgi:outer membrane protein W
MKKIISILAFLSFAFLGVAQEVQPVESLYAPKKNDITVSVGFGIGSYIGHSAQAPDLSSYSLSAPMKTWFDQKPIFDFEGRWFFTDKWALKLTGGLNVSYNPAHNEVTGVSAGSEFEVGDIPTYKAVPSSDNFQYSIGVGADYHFATSIERLYLRAGGEFGFAYGRTGINGVDDENYLGASIGEAYALHIAPLVGVDFYLAKQWYVGLDIRPLAYHYSVYSERPQAGLSLLSSDNHSFTFLRYKPTIKLGFRF